MIVDGAIISADDIKAGFSYKVSEINAWLSSRPMVSQVFTNYYLGSASTFDFQLVVGKTSNLKKVKIDTSNASQLYSVTISADKKYLPETMAFELGSGSSFTIDVDEFLIADIKYSVSVSASLASLDLCQISFSMVV